MPRHISVEGAPLTPILRTDDGRPAYRRACPSPTDDVRARAVMAGIRRELGGRRVQKAPLMTDPVR